MKKHEESRQPIAIVGIGSRFPQAEDARRFWDNIEAGATAFTEIPEDRWDHALLYSANSRDVDKAWTRAGSFIESWKDFAALHYGIAPRRLEVMDPQQRLLIEATRWAIQDAGYETRAFARKRAGSFFGVSVSEFKNVAGARISAMQMAAGAFGAAAGTQELRDALMEMVRRVAPMRAFTLPGSLLNMNAASVAQTFDLAGPAYSIDAACASSSVAIHDAITMLRAGLIDVGIAGGVYLNLSPDNLIAFTKIGAISPTGACRPFDARADGFVQSDAVAVLFLKRLEDALADDDRIHAVILGSGCNNDGRGEGPMTPRVEGQLDALHLAYADAGVSPASIAYFEAHGTATSIGDPAEVTALGTLLAEAGVRADAPAGIGSVKGNIGHAMSAAGVAGLVKAVKMIERRTVPPQAGFERPHPNLGLEAHPLFIAKTPMPLEAREGGPLRVAVSSFGFGGTNSHLILEEPPRRARAEPIDRPIELELDAPSAPPEAVLVTAPTTPLLVAHLAALARTVEAHGDRISLADLAYTLNVRRTRERIRAVIGARTARELLENLQRAATALTGDPALPVAISKDVQIFDSGQPGTPPPRICLLYPGQGAQKVGLLSDWRERFSVFAEAFESLSAAAGDLLPRSLTDYLYPVKADAAAEKTLEATEVCQPVMCALGLAAKALLDACGVEPAVSLGHSLGEFAAMASGGALDPHRAVELVARRGRMMRDLGLEDPGAMAAVMADAATVKKAISGIEKVVLANFNHPRQVAISGTTEAVNLACKKLEAQRIEVRRLPVSHAFHSPLLEGMRSQVEDMISDLEVASPTHPIASCIAERAHETAASIRPTMIAHATAPVQFARGLEQARAAGARVFVQVGAGGMLTSFARATLGTDALGVTLAGLEPDGGYELLRGLCTLAALGHAVDLSAAYRGEQRRVVELPETPLPREPYWIVKTQPQPKPELLGPFPEGDRVELSTAEKQADTGLVDLFRRQAEVLERHAEIIAAQNRVLLGEAAVDGGQAAVTAIEQQVRETLAEPTPVPIPSAVPSPAPSAVPVPSAVAAPAATGSDDLRERVFEIVARISAFPRPSIRADQRLVGELGFDSLMITDLGDALTRSFPDRATLPASISSASTPRSRTLPRRWPAAPQRPRPSPSRRRSPTPRRRPRLRATVRSPARKTEWRSRLTIPSGETWLVTEDDSELGRLLAAELEKRGAKVARVRFLQNGAAAPAKLGFTALNVWPESFAEGLAGALEKSGINVDGLIHGAGLGVSNASDFVNPIAVLHPLIAKLTVPRIAVLTALGAKLGLEQTPELSKNILQGALTGYTKALARERTGSIVRAFDLDPNRPAAANAEAVIDELLSGESHRRGRARRRPRGRRAGAGRLAGSAAGDPSRRRRRDHRWRRRDRQPAGATPGGQASQGAAAGGP